MLRAGCFVMACVSWQERKSLVLALVSRAAERDPIPYALETDWPVGAAGFEPLHLRSELPRLSAWGTALELARLGLQVREPRVPYDGQNPEVQEI
jgi:hypothetical protein